MSSIIEKGQKAPDFRLRIATEDFSNAETNFFTLSKQLGKRIILSFYPADFSPVCSSQIALYTELQPTFAEYGAQVYGISVDGLFCHNAFKKYNNITIPLLTDFEPKGKISKLYGSYDDENGFSKRSIYVIDENGIIQYSYVSPTDVNPGAKEILDTLQSMPKL